MSGQIRFKVGASKDRSVEVVFQQIEARAKKAQANIQRALGASFFSGSNRGSGGAAAVSEAERVYNRIVRAGESANRRLRREHDQTARDLAKGFAQIGRIAEQEMNRAARADRRARDAFAARTSHRATRFLFPAPTGMLGHGQRIAGDFLRGAGVDFSVGGSVGRSVQLQREAIQLANQERIATGRTRGPAAYEAMARSVGDRTFTDPANAMRLASRFAARTGTYGNLDQIVPQLASMATASGADFEQTGSAAGMVYQQLKNGPDAIKNTLAAMRAIIGQSAEGAVDMPDYASQLGRVAAGAFKFEGNTGTNIAKLSALTQLAMERGATSAADAARSTGGFVSTLGKGARIAKFEEAGVDLFTDKAKNQFRDPFEIIKDSFRKTNGNIPQLGAMFADVLGRKSIDSLGAVYKGAGGGDAGIAAIQREFDRYMNAQLTEDTERKNIEEIAKSDAARAQKFQNNLDKIAASMAERVLPALEKMAPVALNLTETFGRMLGWAAENPGKAITAAILASIARAGLESALRTAIDRSVGMGAGLGGIGGPAPRQLYTGRGTSAATGGSWAGAIGAFGIGAAVGVPLAAGMYSSGISNFDSNAKGLADITKGLANQYGKDLGSGILEANTKLKAMEEAEYGGVTGLWGHFKDMFGMGSEAEFKGARDLIERKQAEYAEFQRTGKLPAGAAEAMAAAAGAPPQAPLDPAVLARSVADGIGGRTLNVRITNPADLNKPNPGPGGELNGRDKQR